jgi:hypothetical protein
MGGACTARNSALPVCVRPSAACFQCLLLACADITTAAQSRWLADVLKGDIKLPSQAEQLEDVAAQEVCG